MAAGAPLNPADMVRACGGDVVRFTGLADPEGRFANARQGVEKSWQINLRDGAGAYRDRLRQEQPKNLANTGRCFRKAEREIGPVRYTYQDPSREAFSQVMAMKRQQFRSTGKFDVLSASWIRALFDVLWRWPKPDFGLVFSTVYFGERLAAGEIFLRRGNRLHAWIAVYDRDLAAYSPGHILTDKMLDAAAAHGVELIDFGSGSDVYKARWCLEFQPIEHAVVHSNTVAGRARATVSRGLHLSQTPVEKANPLATRVRGFTDHVFAAHANWFAGAASLATAAMILRRGSP